MNMKLRISETLLDAVKGFEGLRLEAYRCPSGVWTVGYGHTQGVTKGMKVNEGWAERMLVQDLKSAARDIERLGICEMLCRQGQADAVIDFVFNMGITKLRQSTLLKCIQQGASDEKVCGELKRWIYGTQNGRKIRLPGLVARREWEAKRWSSTN